MSSTRTMLTAIIALACLSADLALAATASYLMTFDATWSQQSHPNAYPANAHFSPLIGGVHSDKVKFWIPGGIASDGMELMAERGGTSLLRDEVQAAVDAGNASTVILGSGILSPGSTSVSLQVSAEFPLVTLVTMIAPSPDWFVGVHDLDLREGSDWKDEIVIDLVGYDAGTDNGVNFTSADIDAVPRQPIALIGAPYTPSDPPLGTYTFKRIFTGCESGDHNCNGVADAADYVVWRNGLGSTYMQADYDVWRAHFGQTAGNGPALPTAEPLSAGVPEPQTLLICLIAIIVVTRFRHLVTRS